MDRVIQQIDDRLKCQFSKGRQQIFGVLAQERVVVVDFRYQIVNCSLDIDCDKPLGRLLKNSRPITVQIQTHKIDRNLARSPRFVGPLGPQIMKGQLFVRCRPNTVSSFSA